MQETLGSQNSGIVRVVYKISAAFMMHSRMGITAHPTRGYFKKRNATFAKANFVDLSIS
jgi:hypothetical protein